MAAPHTPDPPVLVQPTLSPSVSVRKRVDAPFAYAVCTTPICTLSAVPGGACDSSCRRYTAARAAILSPSSSTKEPEELRSTQADAAGSGWQRRRGSSSQLQNNERVQVHVWSVPTDAHAGQIARQQCAQPGGCSLLPGPSRPAQGKQCTQYAAGCGPLLHPHLFVKNTILSASPSRLAHVAPAGTCSMPACKVRHTSQHTQVNKKVDPGETRRHTRTLLPQHILCMPCGQQLSLQ